MSRAQLTSTVEQNTGGAVSPDVAGKNAVINGGFDIWQRGTTSTSNGYTTADRWSLYNLGGGTTTWSRESTIVPSTSTYSLKMSQATAAGLLIVQQAIETLNTRQFAGKTIAFSMQAAASASTDLILQVSYSTTVDNAVGGTWTIITPTSGGTGTVSTTASFTRLSGVYAIPSTAQSILVKAYSLSVAAGTSLYFGEMQFELGSVPTVFTRAGGTFQGELTACQRYYYRQSPSVSSTSANRFFGNGIALSTTAASISIPLPVQMRTTPSSTIEYGGTIGVTDGVTPTSTTGISSITSYITPNVAIVQAVVASGLTQYRPYFLIANNDLYTAYLGFSAEL